MIERYEFQFNDSREKKSKGFLFRYSLTRGAVEIILVIKAGIVIRINLLQYNELDKITDR